MVYRKLAGFVGCLALVMIAGGAQGGGEDGFELESPEMIRMQETGSLYSEDTYRSLVEDHRADFVGDTVTVLIYEAASATSKADTDTEKNSVIALRASDTNDSVSAGFRGTSAFDGGGVEKRSGKIMGQISATVEAVLPNGELFIRGSQVISLNNESQTIYIEGRVRKEDISMNNTVLSTRLADSDIRFLGEGLLSEKESPGLVSRALEWLF